MYVFILRFFLTDHAGRLDYFSEVFVTKIFFFFFFEEILLSYRLIGLGSLASSNKIAPLGERRGMERVTHRTPTRFSLARVLRYVLSRRFTVSVDTLHAGRVEVRRRSLTAPRLRRFPP